MSAPVRYSPDPDGAGWLWTRGHRRWLAWLSGFARAEGLDQAELIDWSLDRLAAKRGYPPPPPRLDPIDVLRVHGSA